MAVINEKPRLDGFQEQVAVEDVTVLDTHFGIRFPFAKKVIFPAVLPVIVAVIVIGVLKVAV